MSEIKRITDLLNRTFDGDAWHGPSVMAALKTVTAEQAAKHPIPNAHSIWELVLHQTYWISVVARGLQGEVVKVSDAMNFPKVNDPSPAVWTNTVKNLQSAHEHFVQAAQSLDDSKLNEKAIRGNDTNYVVIQGVIQHNIYHAGQIVLLKKLL
jgi:uncharacterized damage-inducible protein DinB